MGTPARNRFVELISVGPPKVPFSFAIECYDAIVKEFGEGVILGEEAPPPVFPESGGVTQTQVEEYVKGMNAKIAIQRRELETNENTMVPEEEA